MLSRDLSRALMPVPAAAIGIAQILTILDAGDGERVPIRELGGAAPARRRHRLGIPVISSSAWSLMPILGRRSALPPREPADSTQLIAVARRLERSNVSLSRKRASQSMGGADGSLRREGAVAIAGLVTAFDQHRAGEGSGTGTV